MLKAFYSIALVVLMGTPAYGQSAASSSAGSSESEASSSTAGALLYRSDDVTSNTSTVGGTVNNVGVNNNTGVSIPGRADQQGVVCEVPVFEMSAIGTNAGFSNAYSLITSVRFPLGSEAQANCEERSSILLEQARLDTTLNLIRFCIELKQQNVNLVVTEETPEQLVSACNMVEVL